MTLEELQAQVSDLQAEKEAVNAKNKELVSELRKVKSINKEVDAEKYFAMSEELDNLKVEHEKLTKTYKADTEKLTKSLSDKDSSLQRYLIEDGLSSTLARLFYLFNFRISCARSFWCIEWISIWNYCVVQQRKSREFHHSNRISARYIQYNRWRCCAA